MTSVSVADVKVLRDRTGLGISECKSALVEANGDFEAAIDILRIRGANVAKKKFDREAMEGVIAYKETPDGGLLLEVRTETDFVAKNEKLLSFVDRILDVAGSTRGDLEAFLNTKASGLLSSSQSEATVLEACDEMIYLLGEKIQISHLKRFTRLDDEAMYFYIHNAVEQRSNIGKICAVVKVKSKVKGDKLERLAKDLAMHVAAFSPQAIKQEDLDPKFVEHERAVLTEASRNPKITEELLAKIVDGKLSKSLQDYVLLAQPFLLDPKRLVQDILQDYTKELNTPVTVEEFARFSIKP